MNLWHYVEIENVESADSVSDTVVSVSVVSIIFEKLRKIKINNLKAVTIMRNRLRCNDKNLLKNEINAKNAWKILKNSFNSFESEMLNDLLIKLWIIILVNSQDVTNYAWRFKMTMQNIRRMIINVSINDNLFILYFHLSLDAKFEQYREHYAQTHEIVSNESNSTRSINYAINRFLNICVNRSISRKSTLVMIVIIFVSASNSFLDKVQSNAQSKIKNVVIITVKMCTICEKKYHTTSEHRKQFNLKRGRDQFDGERDDRNNKRRRKNDNDDDERLNPKIDDEEREHKIYIVISLEILTVMSAMLRQVAYWALNTICFQHNVRDRSTFIFYTTFSKLISVSDLEDSTIAMRQDIVRLFCKINNRQMNISFSNAFYVLECSLNLISFDQLNDRCSMTYKSEMFTVEDQDIIAKKRVNNVFFFELWKHVSYSFVITSIVDNLEQISQIVNLDFVVFESIDSRFSVNKTILNIWHARLEHLKEQNVRRLTKMSKRMNLIKSIVDRDFCELCIIIKQKIESHNSFVTFDKHFLNLVWSDLVELSISNDKTRYFVTFLCDFIKRSVVYVLRVKSDTFEAFRHFQLHNEHENNRVRRLRTNWEKKYSSNEFDDYRFEHDIEWESIVSEIFEQNEIVERLRQIIMSMISIMLKNVDLNDKWWTELIKTINYFRNRSSMIDKSIILYEVDTKKKFFLIHLRRIETIDYAMKRKSITKWKKLISRSFSIVLVEYEENHIYRMLRLNEIIYRVSFVIWIKKKREESFLVEISKRSISESIEFSTKRQVLESNSIIIFIFSS